MLRSGGVPIGSLSGPGKVCPIGGSCAVLGSPLGCLVGTLVVFDVAVALNPVEADDGEVSLYRSVESTKSAGTSGHVSQRPTPLESPHNYEGVCENEKWWLTSEKVFGFGLSQKLKAQAETLNFPVS